MDYAHKNPEMLSTNIKINVKENRKFLSTYIQNASYPKTKKVRSPKIKTFKLYDTTSKNI